MEAGMLTRKGKARRLEILEAFCEVLAREGLEGASVNKVASRIGVAPSLIMHYFPNKEEMVAALVEHILACYEEIFLPRLRAVADPEERVRAAADALFGPEWPDLVDEGVFYACYSLAFRNRRVMESFRGMYARLREVLAEEISSLMESGAVAPGDPGQLADLVIVLLEGYDFYRGVMGRKTHPEDLGRLLKETVLSLLGSGGEKRPCASPSRDRARQDPGARQNPGGGSAAADTRGSAGEKARGSGGSGGTRARRR